MYLGDGNYPLLPTATILSHLRVKIAQKTGEGQVQGHRFPERQTPSQKCKLHASHKPHPTSTDLIFSNCSFPSFFLCHWLIGDTGLLSYSSKLEKPGHLSNFTFMTWLVRFNLSPFYTLILRANVLIRCRFNYSDKRIHRWCYALSIPSHCLSYSLWLSHFSDAKINAYVQPDQKIHYRMFSSWF